MRWNVTSIAVAIILAAFGFVVWGSEDIVQKCIYWFTVTGFLSAQGFHFLAWVREHDL